MILSDLHVHTTYSDGKSTLEEVILSAIEKGIKTLGFSDHSPTFFDSEYCMKADKISWYKEEIAFLREKYADKIEILCGIEQDYYSDIAPVGFDFVIGSVHYIKFGNEYVPVDNNAKCLTDAAERYFGGDIYALAEEYFSLVSEVADKTNATIIGHFDLITKFCEKTPLFDTNNSRYIAAWKRAVDKLIEKNIPFEINTGAISRGYRTTPYPANDILDYIKEKGGKLILSSDSHSADTLAFKFKEFSYLL